MRYMKVDTIKKHFRVIRTRSVIAVKAYIRSKRTDGRKRDWAIYDMKEHLESIRNAVKGIVAILAAQA